MKLKKFSLVLIVILAIIVFWVLSLRTAKTPKPLPKFVIGKGIWINILNKCESGKIDRIVEKAKWAKLDYVIVKTHFGSEWAEYNGRNKTEKLVNALHAADIKAYAWGYVYGRFPQAEADRAIESLKMGFDGYVWNAEVHMRNRPGAAETHCRIVREYVDEHCPSKILGYSTFGRPKNQAGIPFEVYDQYADVCMPQVYFSWFRGWSGRNAAVRTMNGWLAEQAKWDHPAKPIIPTLEASDGSSDMPATDPHDLRQAAQGFDGYFGINFYTWDVATKKHWEVIRNVPGGLAYQRRHNTKKAFALAGGESIPKVLRHNANFNWNILWWLVPIAWIVGIPIFHRQLFGLRRLDVFEKCVVAAWPIVVGITLLVDCIIYVPRRRYRRQTVR